MFNNANRSELLKDFWLFGSYFSWYYRAFVSCYSIINGTYVRSEWPDGGCYLDQTELLINIFNVIENELNGLIAKEAKRRNG